MAKSLIITADDYGPVDFINAGIETAVEAKCVNTVSVLINPHGTVNSEDIQQNVLNLKQKHPNVKIGVHLSITSGKPVSDANQVNSLLRNGSEFQYVHDFDYDKVNTDELKHELRAQINKLKDTGIEIDHINCHHGLLCFFENFLSVYIELANEFNVPIRQPVPISRMRIPGFRWSVMKIQGLYTGLRLIDDINPRNYHQILLSVKELTERARPEMFNKQSPKYFVDKYYRRASKRRLKRICRKLPTDGKSEMVVHLGAGNLNSNTSAPNGINAKHFIGRIKELEILLKYADIEESLLKRYQINLNTY